MGRGLTGPSVHTVTYRYIMLCKTICLTTHLVHLALNGVVLLFALLVSKKEEEE